MYGKMLLVVVGAAAGYVVGTRRGRKDYEMIKRRVSDLWLEPGVQKAAAKASRLAEEKLPMGDRIADAVDSATRAARENATPAAASASEAGTGSGAGSASGAGSGPGASGSGASGSGASGSGASGAPASDSGASDTSSSRTA